ncbi:(S)-benzoin forming benzil reductase [Thalassobacillus pellis]|uniref:(S)-benzoin forming benzil reductase n=1 Tax=Thalassobacillus pellis TaxID=748008 RepID=UPI00195FE404|nr:(S)-benzoin forming benzil reductase [Thalassobacillus pellis]MBM7551151.1 benzil reductase ((S)-benzoin forming) [Thalassobacillus pellis]
MHYTIITGDSRGLGEAAAKTFLESGVSVIGISRSGNDSLKQYADKQQGNYYHLSCDLSDNNQVLNCADRLIDDYFSLADKFYLINNAGMIEPVAPVGSMGQEEVIKHIQVNLTAPVLLTNRLLEEANRQDMQATIINITSGAADRAVHGWSVYSSTKAAINRFTETTAEEFKNQGKNHHIVAFSPGVMDTDMQSVIRSASKEEFEDIEKFKEMKEEGKLRSPETVAAVLKDIWINPEEIENGKVYKLYDMIKK